MYYQEQNRLWNEMFVEYLRITTLFGVVSSFPAKYLGVHEEKVAIGGLEKYHFSSTLEYVLLAQVSCGSLALSYPRSLSRVSRVFETSHTFRQKFINLYILTFNCDFCTAGSFKSNDCNEYPASAPTS